MKRALSSFVLVGIFACSSTEDPPAQKTSTLVPGKGIAEAELGVRYSDIRARFGDATSAGSNRLVFARWPERSLELVFGSPEPARLTDDARLVAVGVQRGATCVGTPCPGQSKKDIETLLGLPEDVVEPIAFYARGMSVVYGPDGVATQVSAYAPYRPEATPPEMEPAPAPPSPVTRPAVDPSKIGVVDMHLHPGFYGRIPSATKAIFTGAIPPFARPYAPGVSASGLEPFAPILGIRDQTLWANVDHAVLFAVYTQKTTGFYTNEDLLKVLESKENVGKDGLPWAWGLASVNFFDGYVKDDGTVDEVVSQKRLAALGSYFERRPDLFLGIKLAHPHQQIALDDRRYLGVYDVARKYGVPVYLHTGFSPFPSAKNEPKSYDPENFEGVVKSYPDVTFVLGHVGQGDPRSVEHSLELAKRYPNVYVEVSALARPFLKDMEGNDVAPDATKPQLPFVMAEIKKRGIVDKAIFGSDGPQFSGMVKGYVDNVRIRMGESGYSASELDQVFGGTFARVFFRAR